MEPAHPFDPVMAAERVCTASNEAVAPRLTAMAEEFGRDWLNERDHLHPAYRNALPAVAARARPRPAVSRRLDAPKLERVWPRVGAFDVGLAWGRTTVYGELKCGADVKALSGCVWDAPKCAYALQLGGARGAHLIAAAPRAMWDQRALGVELLFDGEWELSDLRQRYVTHWRRWEREGYQPLRVPELVRTVQISRTSFRVAERTWLLGVARVEPVGEGLLAWPSVLP